MKRLFLSIIFLVLLSIPVFSQNIKVAGIASKGGKIVRTSAQVQHTLMETYPSSTITVYQTGTLTLASIFSDEIGTAKANPFTANSDASWSFYVAQGRYDIKFSGTGILVPFTLSDVFVDSGGGGGGGVVTSVFGRIGDVVYQSGDVPFTGLNFTGSNFNSITTRSASDLNAGTLPDARFPATLPAVSGALLTSLNASNISSGTLDDARLSANVARRNTTNTFTQENYFTSNVGINTLTPRRRLDVVDAGNAQIRLTSVDNSVYTDLFTDGGGTLNIIPTGNVAFNSTGKQVNPATSFDQNLGQINKKWLTLHAAELFVETLVSQNTIATIGGRILVAPSNILIADLSAAATTIFVKYNNLANSDRIYMEGNSSVEFLAITSGASVVPGGFSYTVTRNLDGTGANDWFAGDALVNTGVAGDGFIDLYSVRGVKTSSQIGPTIVGNVRNSSTYNDWTEHWVLGNLNGNCGYVSDFYGACFGKYSASASHITVDSVGGIRIWEGTSTQIAQWDIAGNILLGKTGIGQSNTLISAGSFSIRNNITERIKLNSDGSGFVANTLVDWDTSGNFRIRGNATVGNWTIGTSTISSTGVTITSGASANLAFGVTPPTSASVGTGIFLDRTGLYGLNSNVVQVKVDATNGALKAGADNVVIDVNGITLTSGVNDTNKIKWKEGINTTFTTSASHSATTVGATIATLQRAGVTTGNTSISIIAKNDIAGESNFQLYKFDNGHATNANWSVAQFGGFNGILGGVIITGTTSPVLPAASTILELSSTTGAFLPTRMTTTQRDALTATPGMIIYNLTTNKLQVRGATLWEDLH